MSIEPKKAGRKKNIKKTIVVENKESISEPEVHLTEVHLPEVHLPEVHLPEVQEANTSDIMEKPIDMPKKRGRKPKGGKITPIIKSCNDVVEQSKNVILHLKCSLNDLSGQNKSDIGTNIIPDIKVISNSTDMPNSMTAYNSNDNTYGIYNNNEIIYNKETISDIKPEVLPTIEDKHKIDNMVLNKINDLKINLSKNNISDKRSDCFWCSCEFHNSPIFVPKREKNEGYEVYGCFCTPECGVAYLMNENIDSSIKFERYQMMNFIYGKSLGYANNIKPAPDPHYLLDKFYGTLSIEEYRSSLRNNNLLIFIDKPLTHVFPEMINDAHDFTIMKDNNTSGSSSLSQYKIKKASTGANKKTKTKNDIINEKFGLVQQ